MHINDDTPQHLTDAMILEIAASLRVLADNLANGVARHSEADKEMSRCIECMDQLACDFTSYGATLVVNGQIIAKAIAEHER